VRELVFSLFYLRRDGLVEPGEFEFRPSISPFFLRDYLLATTEKISLVSNSSSMSYILRMRGKLSLSCADAEEGLCLIFSVRVS
jgi:hypothetical protein